MSGSLTGATWRRPNGACNGISPEPATTRRYTVFTYSISTAGTYNVTVTRTSGTGVYVDVYQPFVGTAGFECVNRWNLTGSGSDGATSVTTSITQGGPILGEVFFSIVVSGTSTTDTGSFNISVTGPQSVVTRCAFNAAGFFSPATQSAAPAGGSFSTTYTPPPGAGCPTTWTMSGIPAWVSGFPSSLSGPATINYTMAANGGGARNATINSSGGGSLSLAQSASTCTYSLSANTSNVPTAGGNVSFNVVTQPGCGWSSSANQGWLTGVTTSGSGNGTVSYTASANGGGARSAAISVAGLSHTVNQAASCTVSVSPASASPSAAGGTASFNVTTQPGCAWTASEGSAFLSGVTAGGTGSGSVSYTVAANSGPARSANITVAATASGNSTTFAVNQLNGCSYSLSPTSASPSAAGGTASFTVTTGAGCTWSTSESATWITGVTANGTGTGSVSYTVAANSGPARSANITLNGQNFSVNQSSGCSVSLTPTSVTASAAGSTATFAVNTEAGCAWTTSESSPFVSGVTAGGSGPGNVSYTVAANTGPLRSASIAVTATETGASASFNLDQSNGCAYSLAPASTNASAAAGSASFNVTTAAGCTWSASESASWITGVTASGTGSGTISFNLAANTGPARSANITLNGQNHTVNQASGCAVALSPSGATPGASGGSANFNVSTDPGCAWTTSTSGAFVSGVTAAGTGAGSVNYSVATNPGVARSGAITVTATETGQAATFTLDQSNGCVYSLVGASTNAAASGGNASFTLATSSGTCPWTATSGAAWITGVTASGNGTSTIAYTLDANAGPARTGTITAGGQIFTINQADGCVASLPSSSANVAVAGETSSFGLTLSAPTCPWTASSAAGWLSAITPAGTGSANVSFTAAANVGPARSATINAGGQSFGVNQASGCTVSLPVTSASAVVAGGSSSFVVDTAPGCAYTVSSDSPWLSASVSAGGVDYTAGASSSALRVGTITVQSTTTASSATFQVTQADGCIVMLSASGATLPAAGQDARVDVSSGTGCTWQATPSAAWITDVTVDATGVAYRVGAYDGPQRSATIQIQTQNGASATFAVTQQSGCTVALVPSTQVPAAGGAHSVSVTTGAGCGLAISGGASWLSNISASAGELRFDAAQNDGVARSQQLSVSTPDTGDSQDVTIEQASGCSIDLPIEMASFPVAGVDSANFAVSAGPGCSWTASAAETWVESISVTGSGVSYAVAANAGVARTALITVRAGDTGASRTFAVDQAGAIVAPTIVTQPSGVRVDEGNPFELSVVAAGGALSYAWYRDGAPITGANGMSYGAAMAQLADDGSYHVVVSNAAGSITSDQVEVEVIERAVMPDGGLPDGGVPDGGEADAGAEEDAGPEDAGDDVDGGGDAAGSDDDAGSEEGFGIEPGGGGCSVQRDGTSPSLDLFAWLALGLALRRRARSRRDP